MLDSLGDRMKRYEENGAGTETMMPLIPIVARLDGRAFHTFTRGLRRPFDSRLTDLMVDVTTSLVKEFDADIGYTQSDEISLIWKNDEIDSEMMFNGRIQKLCSILASHCSVRFNQMLALNIPDKVYARPLFDCRVFNVPNKTEAINCLIWRQNDAVKNSISMLAQANFSHSDLQNKSGVEMKKMLLEKGISWDDMPDEFKQGSFIQRKQTLRNFTKEEIAVLPPKHEAHTNPNLQIARYDVLPLDIPQLKTIQNREGVIFNGESPILIPEKQ